MKTILLLMLVGTLACAQQFSSGQAKVSTLELFTSQGCGECPDFDKILSDIQESPALFTQVIPIAYHVDYWNDKGWIDPLSNESSTKKQYEYAAIWKKPSIYTPLFVLNGKPTRLWHSKQLDLDSHKSTKPGTLSLQVKNKKFITLRFNANDVKYTKQTNIIMHSSVIVMDMNTEVKSGANKGKKLHNDFVSLAIKKKQSRILDKVLKDTMPYPSFVKKANKTYYIVAWLTDMNNHTIQAVAGRLD